MTTFSLENGWSSWYTNGIIDLEVKIMRTVDLEVIQEILQTKKVEFVLYEVEDVAKMLGVSERTVRRWIEDKKLKAMKLGRGWRIEHDDLMEFMESRKNVKESDANGQ